MSLILDGTNGLSDVDGSAATPAIRGSDANTGVFFGTDIVGVSTGGSERVRVDASGNVGIGTSTFTFNNRLNIKQSTDTGASAFGLRVERQANDSLCFLGYRDNTNTWQLNATFSSTGAFAPITFHTSDAERARITSGGDLLVGTTSTALASSGFTFQPTANGAGGPFASCSSATSSTSAITWAVYSNSLSQYQFYVDYSGRVLARTTSITGLSDQREKENIRPLEIGLAQLMALQPRRFDWKNGSVSNVAGFVAQEVEAVLPDLIDEYKINDEETRMGLRMGDMIPMLVKAIQEQQAIITALTARVEALEGAQA
jgi:hypothetical protein